MAEPIDDASNAEDLFDGDLPEDDEFEDEEPRDPLEILADHNSASAQGQLEWRSEVARQVYLIQALLGEHTLAIRSLTNWLRAIGILVALMLIYLIVS